MTSFFTSKQCWVYIIISRRDDATMIENYYWLWDRIVGLGSDIKKNKVIKIEVFIRSTVYGLAI